MVRPYAEGDLPSVDMTEESRGAFCLLLVSQDITQLGELGPNMLVH
jgi:hypothetical protein